MKYLKICALLIIIFGAGNASGQNSSGKGDSGSKITGGSITADPTATDPQNTSSVTTMKYFVNAYPEFTVLVKAINATELNGVFEGNDPVTVFAPVNKTFQNLKPGTISNILKPEMRDSLKGILTYMLVAGNWSIDSLAQRIKEGGGSFSLPTIGGTGMLTFNLDGTAVWVKDKRGTMVQLSNPVISKNGTIYLVNKLLLP